MMLDLIITKQIDGFSANVPSYPECEVWAKDEDTSIDLILDKVSYFSKVNRKKIKYDKSRKEDDTIIYKLIFNPNDRT